MAKALVDTGSLSSHNKEILLNNGIYIQLLYIRLFSGKIWDQQIDQHFLCFENFRYHVPRSFLKPTGNSLVLLEEEGGNPLGISLDKVLITSVCGRVSETQLPQVSSWVEKNNTNNTMGTTAIVKLTCPPGKNISDIVFASYGNPVGNCERYTLGSCHSVYSKAIAELVRLIILSLSFSTFVYPTLSLSYNNRVLLIEFILFCCNF